MRDDLSVALKKVTMIASYLEAMAAILKESERVLWNFIAELPDGPGRDPGKEGEE